MIKSLKLFSKAEGIILTNFFNFGIVKFNLPDLGQKIKQGTIKKLYIKQGDIVEQYQKVADVASDKQFTQITASQTGVIKKIHFFQQDICQVGELFLEIQVTEEAGSAASSVHQQKEKNHKQQVKQQSSSGAYQNKSSDQGSVLATPFVRGLAKKHNLNIEQISGTGPNGRVTQNDIIAIAQGKRQPQRTPSIQFGKKPKSEQVKTHVQKPKSTQKVSTSSSKQTSTSSNKFFSTQQSSQVKQMSLFEKGMQKSMTVANTIPHLYYHQQMDLTECEKLRKTLKANNKKVTVMGLLIKTFSMALRKYPRINSTYQPQSNEFQYRVHQNHNISVAIDSPNGLVVPNIKNVQILSLLNIQNQLERLKNLSTEGKLTGAQLNNGTICISNIGTIGGVMANPLILAPQVCIVAIGKLQTVAKFKDGQFVPRNTINVSFGCDHRIVDGATVARFSNQWKLLLQNPYIAMADMI